VPEATNARKAIFPLKHVLVYSWEFRTARSLDEVVRRLEEARFYVVKPREDLLVLTSLAKPSAVIIILAQRDESGGDMVVVQTPQGPYGFEELVRAVPVFARIAGIRLTGLWPKG